MPILPGRGQNVLAENGEISCGSLGNAGKKNNGNGLEWYNVIRQADAGGTLPRNRFWPSCLWIVFQFGVFSFVGMM